VPPSPTLFCLFFLLDSCTCFEFYAKYFVSSSSFRYSYTSQRNLPPNFTFFVPWFFQPFTIPLMTLSWTFFLSSPPTHPPPLKPPLFYPFTFPTQNKPLSLFRLPSFPLWKYLSVAERTWSALSFLSTSTCSPPFSHSNFSYFLRAAL